MSLPNNSRFFSVVPINHHSLPGNKQPWTADAKCLSIGPQAADMLFFVTPGGSPLQGKKFCMDCPVKTPCLEYALHEPDLHGIWGGTTQRQRMQLRKFFGLESVEEIVIEIDTVTFDGDGTTWEHETLTLEHRSSVDPDD